VIFIFLESHDFICESHSLSIASISCTGVTIKSQTRTFPLFGAFGVTQNLRVRSEDWADFVSSCASPRVAQGGGNWITRTSSQGVLCDCARGDCSSLLFGFSQAEVPRMFFRPFHFACCIGLLALCALAGPPFHKMLASHRCLSVSLQCHLAIRRMARFLRSSPQSLFVLLSGCAVPLRAALSIKLGPSFHFNCLGSTA
jgi:hypothetical protein